MTTFLQKGVYTLQLAAALALGIILSSTITRIIHKIIKQKTGLL